MISIHVSDNIQELTGIGEEWLVDKEGNVIFIFIEGNLKSYQQNNEDETL